MNQQTQSDVETVDLWSFIEGAIAFVSDVEFGKTRLLLTLDNREVCAVVPLEDFHKLQQNSQQKGENP